MEINYVREFVVLAEKGNFLEAADYLFISQSSLSKHIKAIETELGVPLFNRTTRKVALSEFGQIFLPYAKRIVYIQNEYTTAFFDRIKNTSATLTIGSIPSMAQYNITNILARFKKSHLNSTLNVIQGGSTKLENLLRQNKCELAFIRQVYDIDNEFVKIPYAIDTLAAILPARHPLAECKTVSLEQLKDEEFLLLPKQTRPHNLCLKACEQHGFEPKVVYTDHKLENLIDLVVKEMGVALLMKRLAIYLSNPNIAIVDISPSISTQVSLCYKKNADLSDAAKYFLTCVNPV
ncbi:MAG: LysR family transcriptional regulator [Firmicutes bacterium]|nr:LysR family transcriptional regulator [Bacillota bacterium]